MMEQMGHRDGAGLGRDGKGMTEPIQTQQRGVAGLGYESMMAGDVPLFLSTDGRDAAPRSCDLEAAPSWDIRCGSPFQTISMSKFCLREQLVKLLTMRREVQTDSALVRKADSQQLRLAVVDASYAMLQAHSHKPIFTYARDALKLANLDSDFGVCRQSLPQPFRFAVLAANAQGIAEYIRWKHGPHAEGRTVDEPSFTGPAASGAVEMIEPVLSITNSHAASGMLPEKLEALCAEPGALQSLSFAFCDLSSSSFESLCANSSLSTELGHDSSPDAKLVAISQVDAALRLLQPGADLVVRLGDCLTRWSCGLVYVLYRSFESLRIVKPFSSSPLDPERFVVGSGFKGPPDDGMLTFLVSVKQRCRSGDNVLSIVSMDQLMEHDFNSFVTRANDRFMRRELDAWVRARPSSACIDDDDIVNEFRKIGEDCLARVGCGTTSPLNAPESDSVVAAAAKSARDAEAKPSKKRPAEKDEENDTDDVVAPAKTAKSS
jgi:hypothetical protein